MSLRALLRRLGLDVREGEGVPLLLLFLAFFFIICFFYIARPVRESKFLDDLGSHWLPVVNLVLALCTYPVIRLYSACSERLEKHSLLIVSSLFFASTMVAFWWGFQLDSPAVALGFYVWLGILSVTLVSQFWTYSSLVFDPRQAKRLFGFLGAGGILGGLVGGQVAGQVALAVGTRYALLASAAFLVAVAVIMFVVHRVSPVDAERVAGVGGKLATVDRAKGGWDAIKGSRHLMLITSIMILMVMVSQFVDLQFKWAVEVNVPEGDERTAFWGNFYTVMNGSALIFQLLLTSRIHRKLGVGFAMRVLPITVAVGSSVAWVAFMAFPGAILAAIYVLKLGENGCRYSLEQATRELLYLPVPSKARIKAKAFIDVFVNRGSKGFSAILMLPVFFGWMHQMTTVWISLPLIAGWLLVVGKMSREYVHTFRQALKQRTEFETASINLSDVATLELLVESLGSPNRRQVLHGLDLLASNGRGHLVPPLLLYHDDADIRRRTLEILGDVGRTDAAPLVERQLGDQDPEVRAEAIRVLAGFEGRNAAELMLPKLNEAHPGVRAAAVACLATCGDESHADLARAAVLELLSDADPRARAEAAKALGTIPEPRFQDQLIRLLYDSDPAVVRETISAIRRRVARDDLNLIYLPKLVSLLRDRRLKAEAREALVAFGSPAIPALVHFMGDWGESMWVRRALPKTIAGIGGARATEALIDSMGHVSDRFLRRKIYEALSNVRGDDLTSEDRSAIEAAVENEIERYMWALERLALVGVEEKGTLNGPVIDWSTGTLQAGLLEKLLAERMEETLHNVFRLLAVLYADEDIWASYRSLLSGQTALRNSALEYMDNTLSRGLRHRMAVMLDSRPLTEKLGGALQAAPDRPRSRQEALRALLAGPADDADESSLRVATMYYVYTERISELYADIAAVRDHTDDPFVVETSEWVSIRLRPEEPG